MKRFLLLLLVVLPFTASIAQSAKMRLGFTAGPTLAWTSANTNISTNFFTVGRAGVQLGVTNSLELGEHFFSSVSALYSLQSFGLKQTGIPSFGIDARFKSNNLEFPLMLGSCGYLGSLRHREFVGAGLQLNLSNVQTVKLSGDSSTVLTYTTQATSLSNVNPVFIAGFEVGSIFKNDAAMYFGATFRYATTDVYQGQFTSNRFPVQLPTYNGTYLSFNITYYLPRYSYWFKREFIY